MNSPRLTKNISKYIDTLKNPKKQNFINQVANLGEEDLLRLDSELQEMFNPMDKDIEMMMAEREFQKGGLYDVRDYRTLGVDDNAHILENINEQVPKQPIVPIESSQNLQVQLAQMQQSIDRLLQPIDLTVPRKTPQPAPQVVEDTTQKSVNPSNIRVTAAQINDLNNYNPIEQRKQNAEAVNAEKRTIQFAKKKTIDSTNIAAIQQRLFDSGYYGKKVSQRQAVDGVFGKNTEEAIMAFQENQGLKKDGVAGKNTLSALGIEGVNSVYRNNIMLNQTNRQLPSKSNENIVSLKSNALSKTFDNSESMFSNNIKDLHSWNIVEKRDKQYNKGSLQEERNAADKKDYYGRNNLSKVGSRIKDKVLDQGLAGVFSGAWEEYQDMPRRKKATDKLISNVAGEGKMNTALSIADGVASINPLYNAATNIANFSEAMAFGTTNEKITAVIDVFADTAVGFVGGKAFQKIAPHVIELLKKTPLPKILEAAQKKLPIESYNKFKDNLAKATGETDAIKRIGNMSESELRAVRKDAPYFDKLQLDRLKKKAIQAQDLEIVAKKKTEYNAAMDEYKAQSSNPQSIRPLAAKPISDSEADLLAYKGTLTPEKQLEFDQMMTKLKGGTSTNNPVGQTGSAPAIPPTPNTTKNVAANGNQEIKIKPLDELNALPEEELRLYKKTLSAENQKRVGDMMATSVVKPNDPIDTNKAIPQTGVNNSVSVGDINKTNIPEIGKFKNVSDFHAELKTLNPSKNNNELFNSLPQGRAKGEYGDFLNREDKNTIRKISADSTTDSADKQKAVSKLLDDVAERNNLTSQEEASIKLFGNKDVASMFSENKGIAVTKENENLLVKTGNEAVDGQSVPIANTSAMPPEPPNGNSAASVPVKTVYADLPSIDEIKAMPEPVRLEVRKTLADDDVIKFDELDKLHPASATNATAMPLSKVDNGLNDEQNKVIDSVSNLKIEDISLVKLKNKTEDELVEMYFENKDPLIKKRLEEVISYKEKPTSTKNQNVILNKELLAQTKSLDEETRFKALDILNVRNIARKEQGLPTIRIPNEAALRVPNDGRDVYKALIEKPKSLNEVEAKIEKANQFLKAVPENTKVDTIYENVKTANNGNVKKTFIDNMSVHLDVKTSLHKRNISEKIKSIDVSSEEGKKEFKKVVGKLAGEYGTNAQELLKQTFPKEFNKYKDLLKFKPQKTTIDEKLIDDATIEATKAQNVEAGFNLIVNSKMTDRAKEAHIKDYANIVGAKVPDDIAERIANKVKKQDIDYNWGEINNVKFNIPFSDDLNQKAQKIRKFEVESGISANEILNSIDLSKGQKDALKPMIEKMATTGKSGIYKYEYSKITNDGNLEEFANKIQDLSNRLGGNHTVGAILKGFQKNGVDEMIIRDLSNIFKKRKPTAIETLKKEANEYDNLFDSNIEPKKPKVLESDNITQAKNIEIASSNKNMTVSQKLFSTKVSDAIQEIKGISNANKDFLGKLKESFSREKTIEKINNKSSLSKEQKSLLIQAVTQIYK